MSTYVVRTNCEYSIVIEAPDEDAAVTEANKTDLAEWGKAWAPMEADGSQVTYLTVAGQLIPAMARIVPPADLWQYEARQPDDMVKHDLELIHVPCSTHVCDIEPDDTLGEIVSVAADHVRECPGPSEIGDDSAVQAERDRLMPQCCGTCGGEVPADGDPPDHLDDCPDR